MPQYVSQKSGAYLAERLLFLESHGYLRPGLIRTTRIADLLGSDANGLGAPGTFGALDFSRNTDGATFTVGGWAVFPARQRRADAVLLSWEGRDGAATVFAIASVDQSRERLPGVEERGYYRRSGWSKAVRADSLPREARTIRAWAFDTSSGKAFGLNGALNLQGRE
jgi:hypothetical protein